MPGPHILAVIPARFQSTRLPGKVLLKIGAFTMLERVWRQVRSAYSVTQVVVATDDERVLQAAREFGAEARMTDPGHTSGTDRAAEIAAASDAAVIVNVQGDEPFIDPEAIDLAVAALLEAGGDGNRPRMSTLKVAFTDPAYAASPSVTKVVTDLAGNALYFSRLAVPCLRDAAGGAAIPGLAWFKHLGLYAYDREFLVNYPRLARGPLEAAEKLEQLRALENGHAIRVVETQQDSLGVDTAEELERARARAVWEDAVARAGLLT